MFIATNEINTHTYTHITQSVERENSDKNKNRYKKVFMECRHDKFILVDIFVNKRFSNVAVGAEILYSM
jgi:hypothetical protein